MESSNTYVCIAGIECETQVIIATQIIKLKVIQEMRNYRVIREIRAIRTCRRALSKYTLGQLCNYTFPDPCCHTISLSLYVRNPFLKF
jgi:hypothetical protein